MRVAILIIAIVFYFAATVAYGAGFHLIEVPTNGEHPSIVGAIWYPCSQPPSELKLDKITLVAAKDCPLTSEKLPLIVFSHGQNGDFLDHHDTATALGEAGFIVVALNHPGDTVLDKSRSDDLSVFVRRPADIVRLIDWMTGASPVASKIDSRRIGFFGFSRGGYTGLVLIGADHPDWTAMASVRQGWWSFVFGHAANQEYLQQPLAHDARIKAAVIADPVARMFSASSFAQIKVPVQLWASERGDIGVAPEKVGDIDKNLPAKHEYRIVPNSAHSAFLAPCLPDLTRGRSQLCADAPGFDRIAFHNQFNAKVVAFFRLHLGPSSP